MRLRPVPLLLFMLAGCSLVGGDSGEIVGHRWARALAECGDTYLDFSSDRIDFVRDGQSVNALTVRRVVSGTPGPGMVTFLIEGTGALASKPVAPPDISDVGMVFKLAGDSIKLVSQGTADQLRDAVPGGASGNLVLRRCPG